MEFTSALQLLNEVSARLEGALETDNITYAKSTQRRADFNYMAGNYKQSIELLQSPAHVRFLAKRDSADPVCIQRDVCLLAANWRLGRDLLLVEHDLRSVIPRVERTVGLQSPEGIMCVWIQGELYSALGMWNEAKSAFSKLSVASVRAGGPEYAVSVGSIAASLFRLGHRDEAFALSRRSIALLSENGGIQPWLAREQLRLASLLTETDELEEAEKLIEQATISFEKVVPKSHVVLSDAMLAQGELLIQRRRYTLAEETLVKALRHRERALGDISVHLLPPLRALKICYESQRRDDDARLTGNRIKEIETATGLTKLSANR